MSKEHQSNVKKLSYFDKGISYHSNARSDFIDYLPINRNASILEIGCGDGSTGEMALRENKCGRYVGIEISHSAANLARSKITEVYEGDVEELTLPWKENEFDVLIASEVLEHLVAPWLTLERLLKCIKSGGMIICGVPNVCNYRLIINLLKGKWELADTGVMDRTHLRWFTPSSFQEMFEKAGVKTLKNGPAFQKSKKVKIINVLTANKFNYLFYTQIVYIGEKI